MRTDYYKSFPVTVKIFTLLDFNKYLLKNVYIYEDCVESS